jgi:hypothetical protein
MHPFLRMEAIIGENRPTGIVWTTSTWTTRDAPYARWTAGADQHTVLRGFKVPTHTLDCAGLFVSNSGAILHTFSSKALADQITFSSTTPRVEH